MRHGRFVLPVNASFQAKVPGIVHNASQTGQTLFIEPEAITTLGNELAVAESRAEEAERQVLRLLADLVRPQAEDVAAAQQVLAHLDVVLASAALAEQLQLQPPRLVASDAPLHLPQLRHAALALAGAQVVPNDVGLAGAEQVLLLSGPNAGGKTVLMAAVGAATLMAQLGLPIASGPGARLPVFCGLYCAIGDAQSLQQGLSSFAAQLLGLQALMGEVAPGQLVLIDELGGDTDPTEGGALARAVLERVADAGARGIVTTHLEALKAIAHVDGRFVNAGVGYDRQTLRPTYRLERGAPGRSFALEAAERMGFDAAVLARAREHLAATDPLAEARAQLAVGERALAAAQAELAGERAALEAAAGAQRAELQRREAELAAAEQRQAAVHAQALAASATEARAQLARVRAAETVREAERVAQAMASQAAAAKRAAQGPPPVRGPRLDAATARPDQRVRVHPLGQQGRIVRVEGAQAEVAVGAMRLRARLADLELVRGRDAQLVTPAGPPRSSRPGDPPPSPAVAAAEAGRADVRGLRADEAERALGAALDACLSVGTRVLVVVHGHGTGALRELVRELLQTSPYVTEHRPGERHEGGDGVTVVTLDA